MPEQQARKRATRARRALGVGLWMLAAGAAAVIGLDPDSLVRS